MTELDASGFKYNNVLVLQGFHKFMVAARNFSEIAPPPLNQNIGSTLLIAHVCMKPINCRKTNHWQHTMESIVIAKTDFREQRRHLQCLQHSAGLCWPDWHIWDPAAIQSGLRDRQNNQLGPEKWPMKGERLFGIKLHHSHQLWPISNKGQNSRLKGKFRIKSKKVPFPGLGCSDELYHFRLAKGEVTS